MTTDLVRHQPTAFEVAQPPMAAALVAWAGAAQAANQIAVAVVQTEFCPVAYRGKPGEATAAILAGAELGLSPLASLRAFDSIQGVIAPRAIALRAFVQSQGHDVWKVKSSETEAVMRGRRLGSSQEQESRWTVARAQALGLTGKDNWKKQPEAMLIARATAEVCRLVASDAILGMPYAFEELEDGDPGSPSSAPSNGTRKARRATVTAERVEDVHLSPDPEPVAVDEPPLDDEPAGTSDSQVGPLTHAQSKMLHALFNQCGFTDRDDRLRATVTIVGREVETSNDLTKHEASVLIDVLTQASTTQDPPTALADAIEILTLGRTGNPEPTL